MALVTFSQADITAGTSKASNRTLNSDLGVTVTINLSQVTSSLTVGASDVVETAWIDLSVYSNVRQVGVSKIGLASAGETLIIYGGNDASTRFYLPAGGSSGNANSYNAASSTTMTLLAYPVGRYLMVQYVNGATIQTNLKLAISLIP